MENLGHANLQNVIVNFTQMRQIQAYEAGQITFDPVMEKTKGGRSEQIKNFEVPTSFLPLRINPKHLKINPQIIPPHMSLTEQCLVSENQKQNQSIKDHQTWSDCKEIIDRHGNFIQVQKCNYQTKKALIICNPVSGKKRNVRKEIAEVFRSIHAPYEFYETKGQMDAFNFLKDKENLEQDYSCVVAVGGDGTIHEVVNGLMFRPDKKRVPVAFIPNGTGNDLCASIGFQTIDQSLEHLRKGDLIKMDLNQVLFDADSQEELEQQNEANCKRMRYSVVNAGGGFLAKVVHDAIQYKSRFGEVAYLLAGLNLFYQGWQTPWLRYTVNTRTPSGQVNKYVRESNSILAPIMNGRFGGGKLPLAPGACFNDGLLDFVLFDLKMNMMAGYRFVNMIKQNHGVHVYSKYPDWIEYARGNSMDIENLSFVHERNLNIEDPNFIKLNKQVFHVDGEVIEWHKKIHIEVLPEALDIICDFDKLMSDTNMMRPKPLDLTNLMH